jgi:Zn-dependent protease
MTSAFSGFADLGLTRSARHALARAAIVAAGSPDISAEYLLLAVLDTSGLARRTLRGAGVNIGQLRAALGAPPPSGRAGEVPPLSPSARQVFADARREALHLGHYQLDALHLLLGILYDDTTRAGQALTQAGASLIGVRQQLLAGPRRWRWKGASYYLDQLRPHVRPSRVFLVPLGLLLGCGLGLWFSPPEAYVRPLTMLFVICGWVVSLCLHEFGHAAAAYLGGDDGARAAGYLTLNPLRYANPIFSLVLPVLFLLAGGIGLPGGAVYVNTAALRGSRWERIVAAAGPLGTLLFGLLVIVPLWLPWEEWWLSDANMYFWPALAMLGFLQVSALLFNLLPIPPLDGFGILAPSLPLDLRQRLRSIGGMTMMVLFTLLWHDNVIADAYWSGIFDAAQQLGVPLWLLAEGFEQFGVW